MSTLFNDFNGLAQIPYKILQYLMLYGEEDIWKILKYNDEDCLSKPNLTLKEKSDLIWRNKMNEEKYRVFLKPLIGDAWTDSTTQLRLYKNAIKPFDRLKAVVLYSFEIVVGAKASMVDFNGILIPRLDYLEELILKSLNGKNLGFGIAEFQFNQEVDRESQERYNINNGKTFYGSTLTMCITYSNVVEKGCNNV